MVQCLLQELLETNPRCRWNRLVHLPSTVYASSRFCSPVLSFVGERFVYIVKQVTIESNTMNSLRLVTRRNIHQIRQFHKCMVHQTDAAVPAPANESNVSKNLSPQAESNGDSKIEQIANQIVSLTLVEVAKLSELLKTRLNLPDAPVMPMGGFVAAAKAEEEEEAPQVVQTAFTVKLTGFNEKQKISLIKELKNIMPEFNLVQAKKFVESAPAIIKSELTKDDAEKLKDVIVKAGGEVDIV